MPPSPAYNWLCVLHTTAEILSNIARHKAAQVAPGYVATTAKGTKRKRIEIAVQVSSQGNGRGAGDSVVISPRTPAGQTEETTFTSNQATAIETDPSSVPVKGPAVLVPTPTSTVRTAIEQNQLEPAPTVAPESELGTSTRISNEELQPPPPVGVPARTLQSSKVPSSRIGRLFHYGGLAASLGYGAAAELLRRTGKGPEEGQGSVMMTEANIRRLVSKLSQMRGAALKLGQFLSIQDTHLLPADVDAIFRRVQDSAHYMPDWQLSQTLSTALGPNWETEYFTAFDRIPFAAASIGQVHSALLHPHATSTYPNSNPNSNPIPVAVKVQFPNIRNSIDSDLSYVRMLLTASKILPRGMFLDRTVEVMKAELADECSYTREASFLRMFGEFLGGDERFKVPWVWEGSSEGVLVMEHVEGVSVGEAQRLELSQQDRDDIAARIIELCLKELFEFRAMQTDPNWTNFLWNPKTRQIELVDFGATRTFTKEFMDDWLRLLQAAASDDHEACQHWSLKLGYLTGEENEVMLNAHTASMTLLATPFKSSTPQPFAFGANSSWSDITKQIRSFIPVMLQHRLTPPPRETYSLNRKLSGAFLLAARLDATVDTKAIWDKVVSGYKFES
ncbi:ABC1-domain-containing protein [Macrolepiota fuliginosa MF-IS2]|uniref:ABC1-domain-containing protein n=1 Tax=Macrolepiota fuliginosa MF-IS2 TaxID=1400762 RepID=A0A9P6C2P1_9AGAR|nr:ABC1-domain-containing protein [Macrolepiota fuliginosa MF-IS2]